MNKIIARLKRNYRSAQELALRRICRTLVSLSTYQAQRYIGKKAPLRILLDNSVLAHSVTHETAWISTGIKKWGPHDIDTGYAARVPVHSPKNDSRTYQEVRYLAGIAHLAKIGRVQLFTSAELHAERLRQPIGRFSGYGWYDLGLFNSIRMDSVDGLHFDLSDPKETQLRRIAACDAPLYRALLNLFGDENSLDAYHIYTAEQSGMFCFLHIDFRLAGRVNQDRKKEPLIDLKTKILTPSEFGKTIGLLPVDTNILSFEGKNFPVRPDLHWETQQRNRQRRDT